MRNNSEEKEADLQQIQQAISVLHGRGQVVEIRVVGKFGAISGYYDNHEELAKAVKRLSDGGNCEAVYYTLNPCHEALLARREKNQLHRDVKDTTSDADIARRRWLLLDFDPKRPKGVSATREEKLAAKELMLKARKALHKLGWPSPVIALSGNGYHLLYRVNEPNDAETAELFKKCLRAIAAKSATDEVEVDTTVFNAARITKAYGSFTRKGENTDDRPHRFSKILSVPESLRTVNRSQLEALASTLAGVKNKPNADTKKTAAVTPDRVAEFLAWGEISVKSESDMNDGGKKWVLYACPFNPNHTNAPAVFWSGDGALGFHCFHDSCAENNWAEFRSAVEERKGTRFKFGMGNASMTYKATPAGLIWCKPTAEGERQVQLTNFTARIVTDIKEDDGVQTRHALEIQAGVNGRTCKFVIPAAEFKAMQWPIERLGGEAIVAAGNGLQDHVRAAIQYLSGDIGRRSVYTHTGWRRMGKNYYYLHGGGAIGPEGLYESVAVKLPPSLEPFCLPESPTGSRLKESIRASLRLRDVGPHPRTVPVYAALWRGVLATCDFSMHLTGETGTYKSSYVGSALQHFGKRFNWLKMPARWSDTENHLGQLQFILKDAPIGIDDFLFKGLGQAEIAKMNADRVFRGQGNNAGRGRMRQDGVTLRDPAPPRGVTLSTGEDVPRGESLQARVWNLEVSPGDVDFEKVKACHKEGEAGLYAECMSAFLKWVAPQYVAVRKRLHELAEKYCLKATRDGQHARTPEIVAHL